MPVSGSLNFTLIEIYKSYLNEESLDITNWYACRWNGYHLLELCSIQGASNLATPFESKLWIDINVTDLSLYTSIKWVLILRINTTKLTRRRRVILSKSELLIWILAEGAVVRHYEWYRERAFTIMHKSRSLSGVETPYSVLPNGMTLYFFPNTFDTACRTLLIVCSRRR